MDANAMPDHDPQRGELAIDHEHPHRDQDQSAYVRRRQTVFSA
jgi:hypothetical protein